MKDILSMLQSRIDKRANEIYYLTPEPQCPCPDCRPRRQDKIISEDVSKLNNIAEQQKIDKQLMAEVVFLRRELRKEESRREALHNFHLDLLDKHKTLIENLKKKLKVE